MDTSQKSNKTRFKVNIYKQRFENLQMEFKRSINTFMFITNP